jgi:hypothetical protein
VALFGNKEEKAAQEEAARAEAERLQSLTAAQFAEVLLPAFGPEGPKPSGYINQLQVASWLMSSFPGGKTKFLIELRDPINEGLQALENAGLVVARSRGGQASLLKATRLGEEALAEGDVSKHLNG